VDKDILLVVIPVDEAVARLDVEPLDGSADLGGYHLLLLLLLLLHIPSLLLSWLSLRVVHDVLGGLMVTYIRYNIN